MKKNLQRCAATVLAIVLTASLLTTGAFAASAGTFTDTGDKYYANMVEILANEGIMIGTGRGTFSPNATASRAMVVTVLGRLAKAEGKPANQFKDVPGGSWYAGYAGWAAENGIVQDDGTGFFSPDKTVTGAEMDLILERYVALTESGYVPASHSQTALTRSELAMIVYCIYVADQLPAEPAFGANPELDLWTVIEHTEAGQTFPVTVCANADLSQFEVLFNFFDNHKMTGTKSDAGIEIDFSRVAGLEFMGVAAIETALSQNIWLPSSECPLEYVDPTANDDQPLYIRAGVWEDDFIRSNNNLNNLICLVGDETITAYKTTPAAAKDKGTVEMLKYTTGGKAACAYVYLPAGYDKAKDYNVLYLNHGGGGNAASWFTNKDADNAGFSDGDDITGSLGYAVNILDNMFANGDAEPCIVVTPNADDPDNDGRFDNYGTVLRDLIAAVDAKYSTVADRDHRALAGLSMGSIATWKGGIAVNLENVSWFANMSASPSDNVPDAEAYIKDAIIPALDKAAAAGNKVNMMMNFDGVIDMALEPHVASHKLLVEYAESNDVLEVGENYDFLVSDGSHGWDAWNMYLYDMLKIFFKEPAQSLTIEPAFGANPELDLWTVVEHTEAGQTFPVTICANADLSQFEVLFNFFDNHKMIGTKGKSGIEISFSRVPGLEFMGVATIEEALAQNIWLPSSKCPLEYVDPTANDDQPPYLRAGVWEENFVRTNDNLNDLPYLIGDETVAACKTTPAAAKDKGTVEALKYSTGGGSAYAYVYLPAGYDDSKDYNVLYLLHGSGGNAASWFTNTDGDTAGFSDGDDITGALGYAVNILDNMFANGSAEPCIVVTPNVTDDTAAYGASLRDLFAAVDAKYSTIADRDHRALAGLSMGSIAAWKGGIADNLDNISWFANMSAGPAQSVPDAETYIKDTIIPTLDKAAAAGNKINMMMNFDGVIDMALEPHVAAHKLLVKYAETSDVLDVGENYDFLVSDGSHGWDAWNLYLYDVLSVFFK